MFLGLAALTVVASLIGTACVRPLFARIGQQFTLGDINYTVKERKSRGQFVIPLSGEAVDAGQDATFVIIGLEIINNGKTTTMITLSSFELETPDELRYRPDLRGMAARAFYEHAGKDLNVEDPLGAILPPRISTPYAVVFRLPYRLARGNLTLIIHEPGTLFASTAVVALQ